VKGIYGKFFDSEKTAWTTLAMRCVPFANKILGYIQKVSGVRGLLLCAFMNSVQLTIAYHMEIYTYKGVLVVKCKFYTLRICRISCSLQKHVPFLNAVMLSVYKKADTS
jgi:hypothetical protein